MNNAPVPTAHLVRPSRRRSLGLFALVVPVVAAPMLLAPITVASCDPTSSAGVEQCAAPAGPAASGASSTSSTTSTTSSTTSTTSSTTSTVPSTSSSVPGSSTTSSVAGG